MLKNVPIPMHTKPKLINIYRSELVISSASLDNEGKGFMLVEPGEGLVFNFNKSLLSNNKGLQVSVI